jgi:ribosomal protein S27E
MRKPTPFFQVIIDQRESSANSWINLAAGFVFIVFGLITCSEGGISIKGAYAPVTKLTATGIIILGAFVMRAGYKGIIKPSVTEVKHLKCINCGNVCFSNEATERACPKCSGVVENLEGFFERHPEFRDDNKP